MYASILAKGGDPAPISNHRGAWARHTTAAQALQPMGHPSGEQSIQDAAIGGLARALTYTGPEAAMRADCQSKLIRRYKRTTALRRSWQQRWMEKIADWKPA